MMSETRASDATSAGSGGSELELEICWILCFVVGDVKKSEAEGPKCREMIAACQDCSVQAIQNLQKLSKLAIWKGGGLPLTGRIACLDAGARLGCHCFSMRSQ